MKAQNILETIGRTPHIRINRLFGTGHEVWVKSERSNPGGSIKDRIALAMVEEAERSGVLKPGGTIVEPTSGNTGIALAFAAAAKGYKLILTMPETMSVERRAVMRAWWNAREPRERQVLAIGGALTAVLLIWAYFMSFFARSWRLLLVWAIAVTGIVATMPYIALQLVGIEVVIGALGFDTKGFVGDLPLIIAFAILAAYTYTSGLRAPAMIAVVKDVLIYITIFAAIIVIPPQLGGFGHIFSVVPPAKLLLKAPDVSSLNGYSAYATLAVGSALALFLYPHSITAVLSSKSGNTIRRNMAMLPAYSLVLGLLALPRLRPGEALALDGPTVIVWSLRP